MSKRVDRAGSHVGHVEHVRLVRLVRPVRLVRRGRGLYYTTFHSVFTTLAAPKIGCGSAMKTKTSYFVLHCTHLSLL